MTVKKNTKTARHSKVKKTTKTFKAAKLPRKAARATLAKSTKSIHAKSTKPAHAKSMKSKSKISVRSKARNKHITSNKHTARNKHTASNKHIKAGSAKLQPVAPAKSPRKEKDAFEDRIASKLPRVQTAPNPLDVEKITAILADSRVRQMLIELGGENALAIIRNFCGNHSDDEMAKKLILKISDVRATLNKLHNEGLVNYIREKDSDTGWYSYSWSLNLMRMERWAGAQSLKVGDLEGGTEYYFCPTCGESSVTNFTSAAEDDFRCERCNRLLDFMDEKKLNELICAKK